jgi:uncharacterized protein YoxC
MYLEIFLVIQGIAILLLSVFCILVLTRLWRTIKEVAVTLETLNASLPLILKNMEEITRNVSDSTTLINREVQNISGTINRFQAAMTGIGNDIQDIVPLISNFPVLRKVKNVVALVRGMRVFLEVLLVRPDKKV